MSNFRVLVTALYIGKGGVPLVHDLIELLVPGRKSTVNKLQRRIYTLILKRLRIRDDGVLGNIKCDLYAQVIRLQAYTDDSLEQFVICVAKTSDVVTLGFIALILQRNEQHILFVALGDMTVTGFAHTVIGERIKHPDRQRDGVDVLMDKLLERFHPALFRNGQPQSAEELNKSLLNWVLDEGKPSAPDVFNNRAITHKSNLLLTHIESKTYLKVNDVNISNRLNDVPLPTLVVLQVEMDIFEYLLLSLFVRTVKFIAQTELIPRWPRELVCSFREQFIDSVRGDKEVVKRARRISRIWHLALRSKFELEEFVRAAIECCDAS